MGAYLVPDLLELGFQVDSISLDDMVSDNPYAPVFQGKLQGWKIILRRF